MIADIRDTIYREIVEADGRNDRLVFKDLCARVGRSMGTVHHHVEVMRRANLVRQDRLAPADRNIKELPPELRTRAKRTNLRAKPWARKGVSLSVKAEVVAKLDIALDKIGGLPSSVPAAGDVYEHLLALREWLYESGA